MNLEVFTPEYPEVFSPAWMRQQRIIGEMAGALDMVLLLVPDEDINKEAIRDLIERYRKEFDGEQK